MTTVMRALRGGLLAALSISIVTGTACAGAGVASGADDVEAGVVVATGVAETAPAANEGEPSAGATTAAEHHARAVASAIDNDLLSRLAEFKINADVLRRSISRWCEAGGAGTPEDVRGIFATVVKFWAGVDYLRFGPAREGNRQQRIAFWPDPRGVVRKQVSRALAAKDANILSAEAIAAQSAALQGLPALELLLFAEHKGEQDDARAYRCRFAEAIAGNVYALAGQMVDDWTKPNGWRDLIVNPGPDNAAYHSEVESVSELIRSFLSGQQILRDQIMVPWLKAAEGEKHWGGLPFETAKLTPLYVAATAASLEELSTSLHLDQVAERVAKKAPDKAWIPGWMSGGYASMKRDAGKLVLPGDRGGDLPKYSSDELDALRRVKFYANGLRQVVGKEIAPAAGALIGFNDLDGD